MYLTDEQKTKIKRMVDRLYMPSDICMYCKLDFSEFTSHLRDNDSELHDMFFDTLFKCEEELKDLLFTIDNHEPVDRVEKLQKDIQEYKIKLQLELNE